MESNSTLGQHLRQLMSPDSPKVSLQNFKSKKERVPVTACSSSLVNKFFRVIDSKTTRPCFICTTRYENNQVVSCPSDHHRQSLLSLVEGANNEENVQDIWTFCSMCLAVILTYLRVTEEAGDIKSRVRAVLKLSRQINVHPSPKNLEKTHPSCSSHVQPTVDVNKVDQRIQDEVLPTVNQVKRESGPEANLDIAVKVEACVDFGKREEKEHDNLIGNSGLNLPHRRVSPLTILKVERTDWPPSGTDDDNERVDKSTASIKPVPPVISSSTPSSDRGQCSSCKRWYNNKTWHVTKFHRRVCVSIQTKYYCNNCEKYFTKRNDFNAHFTRKGLKSDPCARKHPDSEETDVEHLVINVVRGELPLNNKHANQHNVIRQAFRDAFYDPLKNGSWHGWNPDLMDADTDI